MHHGGFESYGSSEKRQKRKRSSTVGGIVVAEIKKRAEQGLPRSSLILIELQIVRQMGAKCILAGCAYDCYTLEMESYFFR